MCKQKHDLPKDIVSCEAFKTYIDDKVVSLNTIINKTFPSITQATKQKLQVEVENIVSIIYNRSCVNGQADKNKILNDLKNAICVSKTLPPSRSIGITYFTNDQDINALLVSFNNIINILICNSNSDRDALFTTFQRTSPIIINTTYTNAESPQESMMCYNVLNVINTISLYLAFNISEDFADEITNSIDELFRLILIQKGCNNDYDITTRTYINKQAIGNYMEELRSSMCS